MTVAMNLLEIGEKICMNETLADVRIGLGYTCIELRDGATGIAWTPGADGGSSCTHLSQAGTIQERSERDILGLLASDNSLERALGLAAFNAVNSRQKRQFEDDEAITTLGIQPTDKVVMVGHFGPIIPRLQQTGCTLDVLDLNAAKPGIVDLRRGPDLLAACDVAIITATSIINGTIDGLLSRLTNNRAAVLLGPSTPLCPEAFATSRLTQLSGAMVRNSEPLKRIISQGGGTMLMKRHLHFVTARL
ncbi:MAG: Rossmann-like domain-containing protein [Desulfopila sp.]